MKKMKKQLIKLLNIHGVSGDEGRVRNYLKPILTEMMDVVEVDSYGNLLGTKKIGSGEGATILLSAQKDGRYYDKDKHKAYMKEHRDYKNKLFKEGKIK